MKAISISWNDSIFFLGSDLDRNLKIFSGHASLKLSKILILGQSKQNKNRL